MHPPETHQYRPPPPQRLPSQPPNKAPLKAWWNQFAFVQKTKKDALEGPYRPHDTADHTVFGKSLTESLKYASVQISTANANGDLYVWGYIPVVVAKCGLYLKENATEVPGTFRVNGSNKRMRDLQASFESPPRYGKGLDWRNEQYTTHDVASVFRRYLTQMPEPVIPYDMYHLFRDALSKQPFNQETVITTYKNLIRRMPKPNQYLLLYVLDLLSVFATKSDKNLMTATNLAVIFRPGLISHPQHEMSPPEHALSQQVLEFLIAQQDWFMLDISPPTPEETQEDLARGGGGGSSNGRGGGSRHGHGTPSRKGAIASRVDAEFPSGPQAGGGAWNVNPEAGPSTQAHARQRTGSSPARYPTSPTAQTPAQQVAAQYQPPQPQFGQLTEQITPNSSVPPSPTLPTTFERTRSNSTTVQSHSVHPHNGAGVGAHGGNPNAASAFTTYLQNQLRPSSPLNPGYPHSPIPGSPVGSLPSDVDELMIVPSAASVKSAEEEDQEASLVPGGGGWRLVGRSFGSGIEAGQQGWSASANQQGHGHHGFMTLAGLKRDKRDKERDKEREREEKERIKMMRRRTTMDRSELTPQGTPMTPVQENPSSADLTQVNGTIDSGSGASGIVRSRTLPSRRKDTLHSTESLAGAATDKENESHGSSGGLWHRRQRDKDKDKDKENREKRVLKKQRRTSGHQGPTSSTGGASVYSTPGTSPMNSPGLHVSRTLGMPTAAGAPAGGGGGGREREASGGSGS